MRRLAELLAALAAAPHRAARAAWLDEYLAAAPDSARGVAVGWMLGRLDAPRLGPARLRLLAEARAGAEMFRLSARAVGDVAETAALIWPGAGDLSPAEVVAGLDAPEALFDALDAEARVALARLYCGRRPRGARFAEIRDALARLGGAAPALVAAGLAAEAPPYPRLFAWLAGEGPAPAPAPAGPPPLTRLDPDAPPPGPRAAYRVWPAPPGAPVAVSAGRLFDAEGREVGAAAVVAPAVGPAGGWGFWDGATHHPAPPDAPPERGGWSTLRARHAGPLLLNRGEEWLIWPPAPRALICPVTFVEFGRAPALTLGVMAGDEMAPLAKLAAPAGAAARVAAFARRETVERFGPVRQVNPGLWAEISYEGVAPAPRRKVRVTLVGARVERLVWEGDHPVPRLDAILGSDEGA